MIDVGALLRRVETAAPVDAVEAVADSLGRLPDVHGVALLIADFSGRAVVRLTSTGRVDGARERGAEQATSVPLAGTRYDRVLRSQQIDLEPLADGCRVVLPVTDRGDAIGVLELELSRMPSDSELGDLRSAAHALAYVLIAARRHTDVFEWGQRSTPFELAAEIQRRLLPASYTLEAGQFALAGWLEPASSVGGDTFDYTLDRERLHLSITDAVGHQVTAAMLATLLVGSLRNGRRHGMSLADQSAYANACLVEHAESGQFVTGQLVHVDLRAGAARIVNAGHVLPFRLRNGRAEEIPLRVNPPFGVLPDLRFDVQPLSLEPGDRILFLTDGMQERNAVSLDLAAALTATADLHPREVVQELGASVLHATGGDLRDDATLMCLDWYGGLPRARTAEQGADPGRASAALPDGPP